MVSGPINPYSDPAFPAIGANAALLIDFGSTYTKLRAIDLDRRRILGSGQGPSTATTDIMIGMNAALADLERRLGSLPRFKYRLASRSAAGGLRMVTVGLVRELTAEAARRAALGAGARLVGTFAYRLTKADVEKIVACAPDILLLAGGTDGGNSEVILECPVHRLPVFVKGGALLPMKPVKASTKEVSDTMALHVYLGGNQNSTFTLYEDDGSTAMGYRASEGLRRSCPSAPPARRVTCGATPSRGPD